MIGIVFIKKLNNTNVILKISINTRERGMRSLKCIKNKFNFIMGSKIRQSILQAT